MASSSTTPTLGASAAGTDPVWRSLEQRLNRGLPFPMPLYQKNLDTLVAMGFPKHEAMEALWISGTRT